MMCLNYLILFKKKYENLVLPLFLFNMAFAQKYMSIIMKTKSKVKGIPLRTLRDL